MTDQERITNLENQVKNLQDSIIGSRTSSLNVQSNISGSSSKKGYGQRPDLPDQRDYSFEILQLKPAMPTSIDLRAQCSPVKDQGNLGSCTANALASALEFLENKDKVVPEVNMSRLFIYYNERVIEKTVRSDSGASLRDGIKTLVKQGSCAETQWPYIVPRFEIKPPVLCYTEGLKHIAQSYYRISTLNDMKTCLASGFPFVFGFTVYESFESNAVATTGVVQMPAAGESVLGGHAVLAVGYDDPSKRFIVKNSWGTGWGIKGYFTIPYDYLTNPNLANDMWCISRAKGL